MQWEYKQVLAKRSTFVQEWYEAANKDKVDASSFEHLDAQIKDFYQQRLQKMALEWIKEVKVQIQTVASGETIEMEEFIRAIDIVIQSGDIENGRDLWIQWWTAYESNERVWNDYDSGFYQTLSLVESNASTGMESLLRKSFSLIFEWQKNTPYDFYAEYVLKIMIPWCIRENHLEVAWQVVNAHRFTVDNEKESYDRTQELLDLCVASLEQDYFQDMEMLKSKLDSLSFETYRPASLMTRMMQKYIPWCIQEKRFEQAWKAFETYPFPIDQGYPNCIQVFWNLCTISLSQGFLPDMKTLGLRLDRIRFQEIHRLQDFIQNIFQYESSGVTENRPTGVIELSLENPLALYLDTLPEEAVILNTLGMEGWECIQILECSISMYVDKTIQCENGMPTSLVQIYLKRPVVHPVESIQLKSSVQAFFTKGTH